NLEEAGRHLLFLRPRRFGKSLLLSMLENYYDVGRQAEFEAIFGGLAIGKEPTPLHNRYFILKWDFSCVNPRGGVERIERSLFNHVNASIEAFARRYSGFLEDEITVTYEDPFISWKSLLSVVSQTPYKLYLLIDEYDNFANEVMMGAYGQYATYRDLVQQDGPMKTLFKGVKAATAGEGLERIFITGVSPIVMSDITSGYNIAKDIHFDPVFHDLCGFTEGEIETTLEEIVQESGVQKERVGEALSMMRSYYNGYRFAPERAEKVYNPTLALYFFDQVVRQGRYPRKMLDANLAPDETKLEYLGRAASGRQAILDLVQRNDPLEVTEIVDRFKLEEMLESNEQDNEFIGSFLYYFGMLTQGEESGNPLKLPLVIPNLVIRGLYVERI
ncbi:MAG: AAA family ATPase, partial [Deltaproteobacteria bacterium]